ncbi:glucokinase [Jatrophihabitans endophyticus]|uniref:Glucokinase n=1 Tax=Jatrophihabitans endophyticus TaxID=1206085 RepID=A0A1M5HE67_9ACTN|nr:ROK family protein [Jatrophihabitans endophyticus]SHG14207.1 glucokinase [Jatrophihabitans endophyticus]
MTETRPATPPPAVVALDVGGTGMKGWVCDRAGRSRRTAERPTPVAAGPDAVVRAVRDLVVELRGADDDIVAAGVVVPGMVDAANGVATWSANIGWRDVPLGTLLAADLGVPVAIDHDVRSGGLAEARIGAARGRASSLFVPVGTGIAGAFVVDGVAHAGARGAAGEVGHVIVHPDGEPCACGQHGCVETYASAAAVVRRYRARTGTARSAAEIAARLRVDPDARTVWDDAVTALSLGLVAATALYDPELVVIGGGLAAAGSVLLDPLVAALTARLAWRAPPPLVLAALGSAAGRYGAALIAWAAAGEPDIGSDWDTTAATTGVTA